MGFYSDRIVPRFVNIALGGKEFQELRARATSQLSGEVLEVGFGSGLNVPFYPAAVTRVRAVDPAMLGRKLARERLEVSKVPVDFIGLDGQDLPLEDGSIDNVLTTWTLCTIPDVDKALMEISRVLRPGGSLHFLEHGRSPAVEVANRQDRLTPWTRRLGGGCHPNRQIDELINGADLEITQLENYYVRGPKSLGYMYEGVATKAGSG